MTDELAQMPVIDVDTHWTEPPDLWTSRAPKKFRDRALRVQRNDQGVEQWVIEGGDVMGQVGYCSIRPDGTKSQAQIAFDTFDEVHPGAIHVQPRLDYMDDNGLTIQIVYPNILGFAGHLVMGIKDEEHRAFCSTAYNDAGAEMQKESGGRLCPQAMIPFWDLPASVKELERCQDELELTGIIMPDSTDIWGLPPLGDVHWDPLWDAIQARNIPINFHIASGAAAPSLWGPYSPGRMFAAYSTMLQMANLVCITNIIFSGLLDRYPRLKFVSVESGVGWLPHLLESLDYQYDENGVTDLELRPSEYFRRNIYGSYWFEQDIGNAVERLGEDNIMFETDFPHATCLYPGVKESLHASVKSLEPRVQRKILYETAAKVYQLEVPDLR